MPTVINNISEMKKIVGKVLDDNETIGFVPTMGYLHKGHLSLVQRSKCENDVTVVSIFVNPLQFGAGEDLGSYPRDLNRDLDLLKKANTDYVFVPDTSEMYPCGFSTFIDVKNVTEGLCGSSRPQHFRGVCTVVAKLFNICRPTRTYFGQKDFQQTVVVRKMTEDLNMEVNMVICPTVREDDGLAMSSRNSYLTKEQRSNAPIIFNALKAAKDEIEKGEMNCLKIKEKIKGIIGQKKDIEIEYIEIGKQKDLSEIDTIEDKTVIAVAARLGKTRLIDNILVGGNI